MYIYIIISYLTKNKTQLDKTGSIATTRPLFQEYSAPHNSTFKLPLITKLSNHFGDYTSFSNLKNHLLPPRLGKRLITVEYSIWV